MHIETDTEDSAAGFTLLEIVVSLSLLAILIATTTSFCMYNLRSNLNTQIRYEAMQAAQSVLDDLRFDNLETGQVASTTSVVVGDRTYSVAVDYCHNADFCLSDEIRHISIGVTYNAKLMYETDTVYSKF